MQHAALYARVSTRRQEQEGTIESQLAELAAYAAREGLEVAIEDHYIDQGVSGQLLARPGLDRLRDAALTGAFHVVLCLSPDRLARDLAVQAIVLYELRRQGVEVVFLNQPPLADTAQAQFWQEIQAVMAKLERAMIQDRMRRGRLYRLRQGQSAPVKAPYGYRYHPRQGGQAACWTVNEAEAAVVAQVFSWYAGAGETLGGIARRLNAQHTPSPEGKQWSASTLGRLLRQPAYKGSAYYSRRRSDFSGIGQRRKQGQGLLHFPRYVFRPAEEWIRLTVPALATETLWQATQERLQMNARFALRNSRRTYLLRGLLICSVCGHTLQGRSQGQTVTYQCVSGGKHRPSDVPPHRCIIQAEPVEALIWQALRQLLAEPERIQEAWAALTQTASEPAPSAWQRRRAQLHRRRQRLLDAYADEQLSLAELRERTTLIEAEMVELDHRLAESAGPPLMLSLESFTQRICYALAATDIETKQEVLRLLIERVIVSDDALTIEHVIPTAQSSRLDHTLCTA